MSFSERRRQEFLSEQHWLQEVVDIPKVLSMHASGPSGAADSEAEGWTLSLQSIARIRYEYLSLKYTAGEPINSLRADLEAVVAAHETATEQLRQYERNPNAMGLDIGSFDGYCPCLGLIGLCYLLHRRDLLPRIAAFLDGPDKANAGMDFLIEEFLAYAPMERYVCNTLLAMKPFESLADAMSTDDNEAALKNLHRFLERWYKDLAGAAWHNTTSPKAKPVTSLTGHLRQEQPSYYWASRTIAPCTLSPTTRRIWLPGPRQPQGYKGMGIPRQPSPCDESQDRWSGHPAEGCRTIRPTTVGISSSAERRITP
ncbi:PoNe immunity protein domain-containing protein [Cupriavidus gilardii]|uniref:PoNe immunity protein domain-containing protein n=1 Tax=Cupriavidus gilardii TaxID=82541 RepID=UPI0020C62A0C|nr:PoNe immunity protein domain-containing protein [Cupriavidus gilardii]